jgi:hypothetical protein
MIHGERLVDDTPQPGLLADLELGPRASAATSGEAAAAAGREDGHRHVQLRPRA